MALNEAQARSDMPWGDSIEAIDRSEEPEAFELHPEWPAIGSLDPSELMLSYDRRSDSLVIHFFGRGRPSIAVESGKWVYLLVDPDTEDVIGLRIDAFLGQVVPRFPEFIRFLDVSELRGITAADVNALRREYLPWRDRLADLWFERRHAVAEQKQRLTRLIDPAESTIGELTCV